MRDIAIYGAGGFGRETALMIEQINEARDGWRLIGFFDDGIQKGSVVDGIPLIGGISEVNASTEPLSLVLAVAEPAMRRMVRSKIRNEKINFPTLVHPTVLKGSTTFNQCLEGVIITAGNILTTGIRIDPFVIINLACTIGHDVTLGAYSTLMPSCSISGQVHTGEEVLIGSRACILPGVTIGAKSKIGAGAVVLTNVNEGETVVGVPGRVVKKV